MYSKRNKMGQKKPQKIGNQRTYLFKGIIIKQKVLISYKYSLIPISGIAWFRATFHACKS